MPRRGSSSPPLLSLPLLIISLPIIAFLLLFFVVPYFLSLATHKIKPAHTVKSSWDSLNILLVLFAILCGVFARRNDDGSSTTNKDAPHTNVNHHGRTLERHAVSDTHWFVDQFSSDQKTDGPNNYPFGKAATGTGRLKRSSSSYPDLRQESLWEMGDDRFRFFDDFEINKYHRSPIYHGGNRSDDSNVKEIPIDTSVLRSSLPSPPPPKSTAPPPPPPPPPPQTTTSNRKTKRTHRTVSRKSEKVSEKDNEFTEIKAPPPTPPPPPPPPPRLATPTPSEKKQLKIERIKSNATKEIKMVFASLYGKRKKKQKTRILPDETPQSPIEPPSFTRPPPSPPPPPPPPPLPSMFQSLFRKGSSKSKRIHSFSASVPQPPPPPPAPPSRRSSKHKNQVAPPPPPPPPPPSAPPPEPRRRRKSTSKGRPPLPTRFNNLHDENFNSGGQSPLIPMPPPPPPPPFKVPGFRFVRRGDFVKVQSAHSSRCGSPELEDVDGESNEPVKVMDGRYGIGGGSGFCPSPDVNIKADTFIARLRDEWRLEKINSLREKRDVGLGPIKF